MIFRPVPSQEDERSTVARLTVMRQALVDRVRPGPATVVGQLGFGAMPAEDAAAPDVTFVPVPELAPDQVCVAVAASHTSPVVDNFFAAAQAAAAITAECGNYEMWQLGGPQGSAR
jgi:hypothetical protein